MSDTVLVLGGGVGGLCAALDLANAGAQVTLVEKRAVLGGSLAGRLNEEEPPSDLVEGVLLPTTHQVQDHENIEILCQAELAGFSGEPGYFTAEIHQAARFVTDACTLCHHCRQVCPVVLPNSYDADLTFRKAIYSPLRDSVPAPYVVDVENCLNDPPNYLACQRCVDACEDNAILFDMPRSRTLSREVGAVVVAAGFETADVRSVQRYGYATHPDILTGRELQTLLTPTGPTGGDVEKPSNENAPESLVMVLTESSRICWSDAARHTRQLLEQDLAEITVIFASKGEYGDGFDEIWGPIAEDERLRLVRARVEKVQPHDEDTVEVRYRHGEDEVAATQEVDMVVLATGTRPAEGLPELAEKLGIALGTDGYVRGGEQKDGVITTSRRGIYVAGCASGPKDIAETIAESKAAAVFAMRHVSPNGGFGGSGESEERSGVVVNGRWLSQAELQSSIEKVLWSVVALGEQSETARGN